MVDKDLFLYDLAVVAILKNEGHYLKEWLDYHLLAGVDHFYIYDNESPDNQAELVAPYVEARLVDYFPLPGKAMQFAAYNDAIKRFKFQSRYMAFIDGDEFIYPKVAWGGGISEVVDEILTGKPNAAGVAINWQIFGSNGQEKADYSRGVLERFTRRAPKDWSTRIPSGIFGGNIHVKTLANPRAINFYGHPHYPIYFEGFYSVNENGDIVQGHDNNPVTAEKIVINHYYAKTPEEFRIKRGRGFADSLGKPTKDDEWRSIHDRNEEFDDGILSYRAERAKTFRPPDNSHADERLLTALMKNLSPTLVSTTPTQFYAGKMETFLTCRALAAYLKTRLADDTPAKFFEEASLVAILRTVASGGMSFADARLLIRELPNLLSLSYPETKELRNAVAQIVPQMMNTMRIHWLWREFVELDYIRDLLKFV